MKIIMDAEPRNSRGEAIPLLVGDFVSVGFIGPSEVCAITFKIVEKKMDGQITLILKDAGRTEEHSRRQHFRLSTMQAVPGAAGTFDGDGKIKAFVREAGNPGKLYRTKMLNVSGGGILFAFYDEMPHLNSIFDIEINISGVRVFPVKGKIARIERKSYENETVFMVAVAFLEINEVDREAIINFVFDAQKSKEMTAAEAKR